jgi:hypothetical protein
MSNKMYTILKHVAMIGLPLVAAFYGVVGKTNNWPDVDQVMSSVASANMVLGVLLGYSSATYNASESKYAGIIEVAETDAKKIYTLIVNGEVEQLAGMAEATFKVKPSATPTPPIPATPADANGTAISEHGASVPPSS